MCANRVAAGVRWSTLLPSIRLQNIFWRTDEPMLEAGCHEGNLGRPSILAGARAAEKR